MKIVQQYTTDTTVGFLKFSLDGQEVHMTRNELQQIISWYRKGYVHFEKGQSYSTIGIEGTHVHNFEIVMYTGRDDIAVKKDCVATGGTPGSVDVLFVKDIYKREIYITPNHIVKIRIATMLPAQELVS